MRRMLLVPLLSLVPILLSAAPAQASTAASAALPPECVYAQLTIPQIGHSPMITVCRP